MCIHWIVRVYIYINIYVFALYGIGRLPWPSNLLECSFRLRVALGVKVRLWDQLVVFSSGGLQFDSGLVSSS